MDYYHQKMDFLFKQLINKMNESLNGTGRLLFTLNVAGAKEPKGCPLLGLVN